METVKVWTLVFKGRFIPITEQDAADYKEEAVKVWEFEHEPFLAGTAIEVGRRLLADGVFNAQGVGDQESIRLARAKHTLCVLLKGWNRKTDTGEPLPVNPANIDTLPKEVMRDAALLIERGPVMTDEDLASLKKA